MKIPPDTDETVKIIKEQLKTRGKEVIAGNPPLTEMSLTAYSEIITYSRLLKQNPKAMPEQISHDSVNEIKKNKSGILGKPLPLRKRSKLPHPPPVYGFVSGHW